MNQLAQPQIDQTTNQNSSSIELNLAPENINKVVILTAKTILIAICAVMLISSLVPDVKSAIRGSVLHDFREVLSTAQGRIAGGSNEYTVAKVKTQNGLFLEIYENAEHGTQKLVETIALADKRDGYFNFNGQATNLAIDDIDGDGKLEILAPTFDQNLVGRLNVYNFDPSTKSSERALR
jgi:hypothetical protein